MSGLLGIHRHNSSNKLVGIQVQTSAAGVPIPIVYGQARVTGNLLYYTDFKSISHTSQQSVGGKGGGDVASTTYTYQAAVIMALAEGPIGGVVAGWQNKNKFSWSDFTSLGYSLLTGNAGQAPWSYLTSNHPADAIGYDSTACIVHSRWPLNDSAALDNYGWEVQGLFPVGGGILDANPADAVTDSLTHATRGSGFPAGSLGDLTTFRAYCAAAGLFLSPVVDQQKPTSEHLKEWAAATNTGLVWSGGLLKFIPYGDVALTGNGATYTPNTTPIYDLGDDDFLAAPGENPITVTRKDPSDAYNVVQVQFANRAKDYNTDIAEAKDQASIETTGLRVLPVVQLPSVKDAQTARTIAQLILQRQLYVRNTYQFKLGWRYILLEPMDLVTLTDAGLGMNKTPVRIIEIQESADGELDVTAEDWPFGTASATAYPQQASTGFLPNTAVSPANTAAPVIFEGPYPVASSPRELWIAAAGAGPEWGGCDVYMSTDGNQYARVGQITGGARYGVLSAALASGAAAPTQDTTNTASVDLSASLGTLASGSASDLAAAVTLCAVGTGSAVEFLAYETATLTASNRYNLTTLLRGLYTSTIPTSHAMGESFVRCDQAIFRLPFPQAAQGATLYFKFPAFNRYGASEQSLASVTAYTYVIGKGLQSGAQPTHTLVPSLTSTQDDDTGTSTTLTATCTNLPPTYTWQIVQGFSRGRYNAGAIASGSNSVNPLSGAGYSQSVSVLPKRSKWYQLQVTVGSDVYTADAQVQGQLSVIDPTTGLPIRSQGYTDGYTAPRAVDASGLQLHVGVTDSGGRTVAGMFHKPTETLDNINDGPTYFRTNQNQRDGGGRAYAGLDGSGRLTTSVLDVATVAGRRAGLLGRASFSSVFAEQWDSDPSITWSIVNELSNSNWAVVASSSSTRGRNILTANSYVALNLFDTIPFDASKLYRFRARIQQTGSAPTYLGVLQKDYQGNPTNTNNGAGYILTEGSSYNGLGWEILTTWVKGASQTSGTTTLGTGGSPSAPIPLNVGTVAIQPYMLLNYGNNTGVNTVVDFFEITEYDEDGTSRTYTALDGGGNLTAAIQARNGATLRNIASGRSRNAALTHGQSASFASNFAQPPQITVTGGVSYEPGSFWGPTDSFGTSAPTSARQIDEIYAYNVTASGYQVRARLRQAGSPTSQSNAFPGTALTAQGQSATVTAASAPAANDTYSAAYSWSVDCQGIAGRASSVNMTVQLQYYNGSSWVTAASASYGASDAGTGSGGTGEGTASGSDILTASISGLTSTSQLRLLISSVTGTGTKAVSVTPGSLTYMTSSSDQYASKTPSGSGVAVTADIVGAS